MKIFISQPMSGLTENQIRRNRALAVNRLYHHIRQMPDNWPKEWRNSNDWEMIDNFQFDEEPHRLYHMSNDIMAMGEADMVFFINTWQFSRGCRVEHYIANAYGFYILEEFDNHMRFVDPDQTIIKVAIK